MAVLLHLSDLHLGAPSGEETLSDSKSGPIPPRNLQSAFDRMQATLEWVARAVRSEGVNLECIVITGDVADCNRAEGYDALPLLLEPLVPGVVPAGRVVVVPGNHDVASGTAPSTAERYARFNTLRMHGYVTPLLEGVDIDDSGELLVTSRDPFVAASDQSFVVVAMNSSNHSRSRAPEDPKVAPYVKDLERLRVKHPAVEALWRSWDRRGESDPSWIGSGQLRVTSDAFFTATSESPSALRILALHHQLFPPTIDAEVKPFETMSNLGEVLEWISNNRIDVVLHGHKHVGHVAPFDPTMFAFGQNATRGVKTLVVSAPSGRPSAGGPAAVARLLFVNPPEPRVSGVIVVDLPHTGHGAERAISDMLSTTYCLEVDAERGLVRGDTAQDVHRKLLALGDNFHPAGLPLICRIERGETASQVPLTYPVFPKGITEKQEWFQQTIEWWQHKRAGSAAAFNHGERIRDFASRGHRTEDRVDQFEHAIRALSKKDHSTRAIAILVDPSRDLLDPEGPSFPAFTLVQFAIEDERLNLTAYFRKQEIPHWWPINVGELALLQRELAARLTAARGSVVSAGTITTITAQAVRGGSVPRVSVPWLDQQLDVPLGVLQIALPLFGGPLAVISGTGHLWEMAFEDWEPQESPPADGDPLPVKGLNELRDTVARLAELHNAEELFAPLCDKLDALRVRCIAQAGEENGSGSSRTTWIKEWKTRTSDIREFVNGQLRTTSGSS